VLTQRGTRHSGAPSYARDPSEFIRGSHPAFGYSFKESSVKQNQSPEGVRRPAAKSSIVLLLYQRVPPILLCQRRIGWKLKKNFQPLLFSAVVRGDPLRIYGKALRFLKLESSRQTTVKIWWY